MPEQPEKKDVPAEETSSSSSTDDEKREERQRDLEISDEIEEWKKLKGLATKPRIREVIDGEILRLQILQKEDHILDKKKIDLEQRPVMIQVVPPSPEEREKEEEDSLLFFFFSLDSYTHSFSLSLLQ